MRSIEFPYAMHRGTPLPLVPLHLRHGNEWIKRWAYVDSGATYSLFHYQVAVAVGANLSNAPHRRIIIGDGSYIEAQFLKLPVRIGEVELRLEIGFSEKLGFEFNLPRQTAVGLVGRKDVFEKFQVCFSDAERKVTFHLGENSKE